MISHDASVVLLHASASSARQWQSLADALAPRFRVHAIDLHGHGERTPWSRVRPLTLADDAALAAPVFSSATDVHLVGHSYGGAVALKLAATYPRQVRSVMLYEPVMFRWLADAGVAEIADVTALVDAIRERLAAELPHDAAQVFIDYWSGRGAWLAMSTSRKQAIAVRMPSILSHFDALFSEPLALRQAARLSMPMMLMTGERTVRAIHKLAQLARSGLPAAKHSTLAQAGHMGPITCAGTFNREVLAFLEREVRMAA